MRFLALIPARYASTRFPGKPLAILNEKPIIQHVYERVSKEFEHAYVVTDDDRIAQTVEQFGGKFIMTGTHHKSGTDRCNEALTKLGIENFDVVVNIQGDEPFIHHSQLQAIKQCFNHSNVQIATLIKPFDKNDSIDVLENPNSPKVVVSNTGTALYFSRSVIPYLRNIEKSQWLESHVFYKHIGLYAYTVQTLQEITQMPIGELEQAESLEQLRWLQAGYIIQTAVTNIETIGIDTPEDLEKAKIWIQNNQQGK
ncbi:MAG: 3-deoxy-manno-octulosonate cytidylyltransferase [Bacteroidaceae bacterium]|nr:3-deoxy-manno-octulosonate cytidylyltransferase [Bacteroidaceae bacterium]